MKRPLCLLDQFRDVVKAKPRPEIAEIACSYLEDLLRAFSSPVRQPTPERFVDDITERPAGAARLRLQLCRHVVVQRKSRSHALMLQNRHHDVKGWSHAELRTSARTIGPVCSAPSTMIREDDEIGELMRS